MNDMDRLVDATGHEEACSVVKSMFGDGAQLYAVDPAFNTLTEVPGDTAPPRCVAIDGELRRAMLTAEASTHDGVTWTPIAERGHTVFAVRTEGNGSERIGGLPRIDVRAIGSIMRGHRSRFEDLEMVRRRESMSVAAEIQWDYLPVRADDLGEYRVAGVLVPAYSVAGDMFDYAVNDGAVWAYSFDGMGHGLEATMSTMMALGAVRNARRRGAGLVEQMTLASDTLYQHHGGDRFVTGAGCCIRDDRIDVVNAGHEPLRTVADGNVSRLELDAEIPLGIVESHPYEIQSINPLAVGDGLVLFSDGGADARSTDGTEFTSDQLDRALADEWSTSPLSVAHCVVDEVLEHIGTGDVTDDITAVVVTRDDTRNHRAPV